MYHPIVILKSQHCPWLLELHDSIVYTQNEYKKQKIFSEKQKDLGMACHTPPLEEVKKQGEMPLPSLGPIPLKKM